MHRKEGAQQVEGASGKRNQSAQGEFVGPVHVACK